MLVAMNEAGAAVVAITAERGDGYRCPSCNEPVVLKAGLIKVAHFAHKPKSSCPNAGESLRHLGMKLQMMTEAIRNRYDPRLEVQFGREHRADLVIGSVVVECQSSAISVEDWHKRTVFYNEQGYSVLWLWDQDRYMPRKAVARGERFFRIPAEIRACHGWTGTIFGLAEDGPIQSVDLQSVGLRGHGEFYNRDGEVGWSSGYVPKTIKEVKSTPLDAWQFGVMERPIGRYALVLDIWESSWQEAS